MAGTLSKHLFLWRPVAGTTIAHFASFARPGLEKSLAGCGAAEVWLHVTEELPPRGTPVPYSKDPLALVSAKGSAEALKSVAERLQTLPGTLQAWSVDEAIPVVRKLPCGPGERAPGACLLTFIRQNPKLTREQFLHEWFEHHTPLSLKVHPLVCYVRNRVLEPLLPGTTHWDGIVAETFTREDLTSTRGMFGGTLMCLPNMIRVGLHVSKFLEFKTIEDSFVNEYLLDPRSLAGRASA